LAVQNYLNESLKMLEKGGGYSSSSPHSLHSLDSKPLHLDTKILINQALDKK
jgi:hypothetical protein